MSDFVVLTNDIYWNPVLHGPFATSEKAEAYAKENAATPELYMILRLNKPKEKE